MRTTSSQPSSDMVLKFLLPPPMLVPALVTRTSMRPWRFSMSAAVLSTAARSPTSSRVASALPAFFRSARPLSFVRALRPEMTTCAPARASSSAPARPMPLPPPVIQATLPRSSAPGILLRAEQVLSLLGSLRPGAPPVGEHLQRPLHRGARQDRVAPALPVRVLVDVHALALGKAQPGNDRHVGDGVFAAGDELRLDEPALEHAVQPVRLVPVAVHRVLDLLRRIAEEMVRLAKHRADVPHLEHHPLHHVPALAQILGQEFAGLGGEVKEHRAGFGERERLAA